MSNTSTNRVRVEQWNVRDEANRYSDNRKVVNKIAVRNHLGQFHGATNFRGSVVGK